MVQTNVVEKIKTHILFSITMFRKSCRLCDKVKNAVKPERLQTIWRKRVACWVSKATHPHVDAPANPHTNAHARTHALVRTHKQKYVILTAFPRQKLLHDVPQCNVIRTLPVLFLFRSHYVGSESVMNVGKRLGVSHSRHVCFVTTDTQHSTNNIIFLTSRVH